MTHGKRRGGLRSIGERLARKLETSLAAWEQSRLLVSYTRLRQRFTGPPVPGMPHTTNLDPYVFVSVGLHVLAALFIYFLATQVLPLSERSPVSVRILETKTQAPAPAREQKPIRRQQTRKARKQAVVRPKAKAAQPKPRPAPPKPAPMPTFTPKAIPRVASVQPKVSTPVPKTFPNETITQPRPVPAAKVSHAEKGLIPAPVKPFEVTAPPATAPSETPRSLAGPPPTVPEAGPTKIAEVPTSTANASGVPQPAVPTELSTSTLEGFQQPTGPVVVPERFLKGGRPQATPGAALEQIDTSDPDFTEYFELIKRRVYAAWRYPRGVQGVHKVSLRFALDRVGASHNVQVVRSTNSALNAGAVQAMNRASPFPPIPEKFRALVGQPLTLIFTVTVQ